ncbi:MAG: LptE family protein [Opitutaceae bacterium]|nr:LptE family protein [Opitutaceae bacterium]
MPAHSQRPAGFAFPPPPLNLLRFICGIAVILLGLAGCAHYQLGNEGELKFSRLYIAPVASDALVPQSRALVTTALREAFVRDGRVSLVDFPSEADAVLHVKLLGYERSVGVSRQDDTGLARRFDVTLRASATLRDNRSPQVYFADRPLAAKRGVFTDSGLVPAEYQLMPLLAEELAKEALHAVVDTW